MRAHAAPRRGAPPAPRSARARGDDGAALIELSHAFAEAPGEEALRAAVAAGLGRLFPGRPAEAWLVEPCPAAGAAPAPPPPAGFGRAVVAPLEVSGVLHGWLRLAAPAGAGRAARRDEELLHQLAWQAALAVRNARALGELASLKAYLEDLIQHANAPIAVVDRGRRVTVWNGALARLTGAAREAAVGRELGDFAPAAERAVLEALLDRVLAGEAVDGGEAVLRRADGGEARLTVNAAPVRGPAGAVEGVVAIAQDVTRLRSLEAAAEQAERMAGLGRLAAGIVHELNNPLTAVTMYAESLQEKWAFGRGDPADLEKIKAIREAGQRIQKLARDLMAYARPRGGAPETLELAPLVEQALRMCKPALKDAGAVVETSLAAAPAVLGSRAALTQVVVNLVTNAAQALGAGGGTVRVALGADEGGAVLSVADDGEGLSDEARARAFEPFFTTRPGRGIGLGLAIVREIVERHRGTVALEAAAGGRGAVATVRLPRGA